MKDGIIIQARTGSTRLHNKILLPFYGGQRIIDILIGNIKQACAGKTIVLATTDRPQDDILAEVARDVYKRQGQHGVRTGGKMTLHDFGNLLHFGNNSLVHGTFFKFDSYISAGPVA